VKLMFYVFQNKLNKLIYNKIREEHNIFCVLFLFLFIKYNGVLESKSLVACNIYFRYRFFTRIIIRLFLIIIFPLCLVINFTGTFRGFFSYFFKVQNWNYLKTFTLTVKEQRIIK